MTSSPKAVRSSVAEPRWAGAAYGLLSRGWSDLEFYAGGAALIALIGGVGLPWMEYAPDGAWRRNPQP